MNLRWLLVPAVGILAWCSTRPLPDGGARDSAVDGARIEPLCGRVCAHINSAPGCMQADCEARCRSTYVMAGDTCAPLYENYLRCAETATISCSFGGAIDIPACESVHGAASACTGGPADGGI
jgi:hypothetical protein